MYLLDNPNIKYFNDPWPHIVIDDVLPIDVADYMLVNFPAAGDSEKEQRQNKFRGYPEDPVFKEFIDINQARQQEIEETLSGIFQQPKEDLKTTRYAFKTTNVYNHYHIEKKWHTDNPHNKYMVLMYFGSGEGGWFEMANPETKQLKRYRYIHNRAIIYNNAEQCFHRYYSSNITRRSMFFALKFKDLDKRNYTDKYAHLQVQDNIW
jgi:hypothetical protein